MLRETWNVTLMLEKSPTRASPRAHPSFLAAHETWYLPALTPASTMHGSDALDTEALAYTGFVTLKKQALELQRTSHQYLLLTMTLQHQGICLCWDKQDIWLYPKKGRYFWLHTPTALFPFQWVPPSLCNGWCWRAGQKPECNYGTKDSGAWINVAQARLIVTFLSGMHLP